MEWHQSKSSFHDDYAEIKDTDLGHTDLGEFLRIYNKPMERSALVSSLIHFGLVNATSHPILVQLAELIMTLAQHFIPKERVVKSVIGEVVLDLQPNNIQRDFHLPRANQFIRLSYEVVERWYREHQKEVTNIIQSSYRIEKPP